VEYAFLFKYSLGVDRLVTFIARCDSKIYGAVPASSNFSFETTMLQYFLNTYLSSWGLPSG
jgi:hypothetical protein